MKKKFFLVLMFICLLYSSHAEGEFVINGTLHGIPLVFEPEYNILGIDLGTAWQCGYVTNSYMIGLGASFDYTMYDNQAEEENLNGTWLHTRILLEQEYTITPNIKTHWAAGGIWLNNTITYGASETEITDYYGLSFTLDLQFRLPVRFLLLEILNRIDLLYSLDDEFVFTHMAPHYYGGIRLYLDFNIPWFHLYLEAQGHYWNYRGTGYTINTGIVRGGLGCYLKIPPFTLKKKNTPEDSEYEIINTPMTDKHEGNDPSENEILAEEEKLDPEVVLLKNISRGDMAKFHSILFVRYSEELLEVSYSILDQIIIVLQDRQHLSISISAYAEYQENPEKEFKLYTSRAKQIKDYLVEGGIEEKRLKVSSIGQIVTDKNLKQGLTVIFKVVQDEENGE
jgi:outer membrane protein OmpA-like peptidoglycan-associated protein